MAKNGILLDRDGNEIPTHPMRKPRHWSIGPVAGSLFSAGLIALIAFAGITFLGALFILFLGFWLVRLVLSILGFTRPPGLNQSGFYRIKRGK